MNHPAQRDPRSRTPPRARTPKPRRRVAAEGSPARLAALPNTPVQSAALTARTHPLLLERSTSYTTQVHPTEGGGLRMHPSLARRRRAACHATEPPRVEAAATADPRPAKHPGRSPKPRTRGGPILLHHSRNNDLQLGTLGGPPIARPGNGKSERLEAPVNQDRMHCISLHTRHTALHTQRACRPRNAASVPHGCHRAERTPVHDSRASKARIRPPHAYRHARTPRPNSAGGTRSRRDPRPRTPRSRTARPRLTRRMHALDARTPTSDFKPVLVRGNRPRAQPQHADPARPRARTAKSKWGHHSRPTELERLAGSSPASEGGPDSAQTTPPRHALHEARDRQNNAPVHDVLAQVPHLTGAQIRLKVLGHLPNRQCTRRGRATGRKCRGGCTGPISLH